MKNNKVKITLDQYYGITETKKKNGLVYIYLRYRNGGRKEHIALPDNFFELNKVNQQKEYKVAKEQLDIKLRLTKSENKDMRKASILCLIDKYLKDVYDTKIKEDVNYRRAFDDKQFTTRPQIARHTFSECTVEDLVDDDYFVKEFFRESREGYFCEKLGRKIKPCAQSTIDKQVLLLIETLRFARFDKKWISRDDFEIIEYQIKKYKNVGSYSKMERDEILSKQEFALFHKEIFSRLDTQENYKELFQNELDRQCDNEALKEYILYLFKMERKQIMPKDEEIKRPSMAEISYEEAIQLYNSIELTVKEKVENGFMNEQPELHYPVVRYYRDGNGHFTTTIPEIRPRYADLYKIMRKAKTKESVPYYTYEGSLAALFLVFNINTGLRFNENRSLQVKNIKRRVIEISKEKTTYAYYVEVKNQVYSIYKRDVNGNVLYDETGMPLRMQIAASLKTEKSEREVPLNKNAVRVLQMVEKMSGTHIFNTDGSISDEHAERYIFINYNKLNYESKKFLGRKPVYYKDFRSKLTYRVLKEMSSIDEETVILKYSSDEERKMSNSLYFEQLKELKRRIEEGEQFVWDKQVYVVQMPGLLSNSNTNKVLKHIVANMRLANPEKISIHSLRKTAASIMAEQGKSKIDIKHIIGHTEKSDVTEKAYIITCFIPALNALESLDEVTESTPPA